MITYLSELDQTRNCQNWQELLIKIYKKIQEFPITIKLSSNKKFFYWKRIFKIIKIDKIDKIIVNNKLINGN